MKKKPHTSIFSHDCVPDVHFSQRGGTAWCPGDVVQLCFPVLDLKQSCPLAILFMHFIALCKVHFNATVPSWNTDSDCCYLLEWVASLENYLRWVEQPLSLSPIIYKHGSINNISEDCSFTIQLQMLRCCDSRKYNCVWERFVLTSIYQISLYSA